MCSNELQSGQTSLVMSVPKCLRKTLVSLETIGNFRYCTPLLSFAREIYFSICWLSHNGCGCHGQGQVGIVRQTLKKTVPSEDQTGQRLQHSYHQNQRRGCCLHQRIIGEPGQTVFLFRIAQLFSLGGPKIDPQFSSGQTWSSCLKAR